MHSAHRRPLLSALALLVLTGVAACGGGSSSASHRQSPSVTATATASATSTPFTPEQLAVKSNWEKFFDVKTPLEERISLLQNGARHAPYLKAATTKGQAPTSAAVKEVTVSGDTAVVIWDLLLAGAPVLPGQRGTAHRVKGVWQVGDASYCALVTLGNHGKPTSDCMGVS